MNQFSLLPNFVDPFGVKRWSKGDPRRFVYVFWSRVQEWRAQRSYESNALPIIARSSGAVPNFAVEDTSVTKVQARELLSGLAETEFLTDPVVEIGCYRGVTTGLLATHTRRPLIAVDPFAGYGGADDDLWRFNQRVMGQQNVRHLRLTSGMAAQEGCATSCSFVFIDAVHDYVNTRFDGLTWGARLSAGGVIAFHDTDQRAFAGTRRFVFELSHRPNFELYAHVENLTILRKLD